MDRFVTKTSWDDGDKLDMKIANLLLRYDLPGTFYIPNDNGTPKSVQLSEDQIRELSKLGFEIGGHTYSHPEDLKQLNSEQLKNEIEKNKKWLEDLIGKKITSFCYPSGRYNNNVINAVKRAGYEEARTTIVGSISHPEDSFRIKTSVHVYPDRKEYLGTDWLQFAKKLFDDAKRIKGYYHIWGHSWEIDKYDLWKGLEELFKYISKGRINKGRIVGNAYVKYVSFSKAVLSFKSFTLM